MVDMSCLLYALEALGQPPFEGGGRCQSFLVGAEAARSECHQERLWIRDRAIVDCVGAGSHRSCRSRPAVMDTAAPPRGTKAARRHYHPSPFNPRASLMAGWSHEVQHAAASLGGWYASCLPYDELLHCMNKGGGNAFFFLSSRKRGSALTALSGVQMRHAVPLSLATLTIGRRAAVKEAFRGFWSWYRRGSSASPKREGR